MAESPIVLVTSVGSRPGGAADVFSSLLAKSVKGAALRRALSTALGRRLSDDDADRTGTAVRAARPLSILLAEDNAVNQRVAQLMLDMLGHQVHTVDNGLAAAEAAQEADYDVILMDVQMPQLDGLDARRILQQTPPDRRPHIIAMTASALAQDRDACTEAGMEGYLMKPVRGNDLRAALAEVSRPDPAAAPQTNGSPTAGTADDADECTPAIDEAALEQLMEQLDDESGELLRELIDSYLSDSTPDVAGFVAAADANDATAVLRIAHSLRSTSGLLGAKVMVGLLRDTEDAARTDSPDLGPMARAAQQEFERVSSSLRQGRRQPALTRAE